MRTSNIEHPTSNIELKAKKHFFRSMFDVGCSMFDVQTSAALLLSCVVGIICYLVAGNSLDQFLASIFFGSILMPPFSAIAGQSPGGWLHLIAITLGTSCCWFMPLHQQMISPGQLVMCLVVLISLLALLMTTVQALMRLKVQPVAASAIVTIAILAWLTWPIWLSPSLAGSQLRWSVMFQPIFAINHILSNLGIWTEQQVAYNLTSLGQDVQYQLPTSVWPIIGLQFGLAIVPWFISRDWKPAQQPGN
jgi:hypothetical protein